MKTTKIILISIGGAAALGAILFAVLIWSSSSKKSEIDQELEDLQSNVSRLSHAKIYPSDDAVMAMKANQTKYAAWREEALALASAGDLRFEETTPASFKAYINEEAKRLGDLPGDCDGRFVRAGFGFGFDEYINKGLLPSVADLPRLQREWNDLSVFISILIDAKASSIVEIQMAKAAAEVENPRQKKSKFKKTKDNVARQAGPDITRFDIVFTAGSEALVKVLNDIAANPRFVVAESWSFERSPDSLADKLGEKTVKKREGGRRRRGESRSEEPSAEGENQTGIVTSPEGMDDFKVTMKVAVYDFRTRVKVADDKEEK